MAFKILFFQLVVTILLLFLWSRKIHEIRQPKIYTATYYSSWFEGRRTALGQVFHNYEFTAATSIDSFLGKKLWFQKAGTNKKVLVLINDRIARRLRNQVHFDLSQATMRFLAPEMPGHIFVTATAIQQ